MKIAVTGSRGLIGSHIKERLKKDGHFVTEWDLKASPMSHDIDEFEYNGEDYVIHMAAWADVRASIDNPEAYWENNVTNTTRIQKICHYNRVPLIYASSSCVHAWWLSPYGISKKVNEETAFDNQIGLRFTTVYGDGARESMLIGRLITGDVEYLTRHVRDFIHVSDVVEAIMIIMDKSLNLHKYPQSTLKPVYEVGTGTGVVVHELGELAGLDVPIENGYDCEAQDNTADISDLKELGWESKIKVEEYIAGKTIPH